MSLWDRYVVSNLVACACATKPIRKQREKVSPLAEGKVLSVAHHYQSLTDHHTKLPS